MKHIGIKSIIVLLSCILILFASAAEAEDIIKPGDIIQFGHYEQDNKTDNGSEPIEWIVLDIQENKALLISRYILNCLPHFEEQTQKTWLSSYIRSWLNNEFLYETFTESERSYIVESEISISAEDMHPEYLHQSSYTVSDRVFLLSHKEAITYFPENNDRKAIGTEFARAKGAKYAGITTIIMGEADWWLRTPGRSFPQAEFINVYGDFDSKNNDVKQGIRPAIWLDISTDPEALPFIKYMQANDHREKLEYGTAATIFESINNYYDSAEQATECNYLQAIKSASENDFDTAIELFEKLNNYKESIDLCRQARYDKAMYNQKAGDYLAAVQLYGEAGIYKDSMTQLRYCLDKLHIPYRFFTEEAKNTGFDNGYRDSKKIGDGDKHFGWRLGRFFIYNYTSVVESNNGESNPIFIKTLGDSITLWFDLEQDIDALHGNPKLIIAEDTNGHDEHFQQQQTNFGRGALIVKHTDYRNDSHTKPYFNFLQAEGTTSANTKLVLYEEGDYEIALDYEMQDTEITHLTNKWANYKIFIKFSIRNGNCMVYPFDVLTKAELQNTAITENGFYLDLARSRYLDINVKRSVIIKGATGVIEDIRFNRPANDGDEYTEKGIYTITVKNRYTGETTEKTLFVGNDELLQEYIENGFSADRLK